MTGPAHGIRSAAIRAHEARTPQQQVLFRNAQCAKARRLGIIGGKGELTEEQAADAVLDKGFNLETCLAFAALGSRVTDAYLTSFASANRGKARCAAFYVEAAEPRWNVVRILTHEENARLVTPDQLLASGAALPGLMGKAVEALRAAAAAAKPVTAAAAAARVKAPKPLTLRERYQAHGRTLSLESKRRWTRRIFSHLHPIWTRRWWGSYTPEHGESLRDEVQEHLACLVVEARADYQTACEKPILGWTGPYTQEEVDEHDRRHAERKAGAEAHTLAALQNALDGEYLAHRCPTVCAVFNWGRGTLDHPTATLRKAAAKKDEKRAKRMNAREREEAERAAAAAFRALPDHIAATSASAYTQPMEQIRSLNFKNLPLAATLSEQAQLREALGALVARAGASVAKVRGALFVPTQGRGGPTKGFGFVECATAAGAQHVIMEAGARGTLELEFNGVTSQVFVELAASNRQSKEQMEAKKAKDAKEREDAQAKCRALVLASLRPATKVELASEEPATATATSAAASEAPVLAKVCLGATAKARREAEAAETAAALKAAREAMFNVMSAVKPVAAKAPTFKMSFAASAKKGATAAKMEVLDEFTIKVDGVVKRIEAMEGTDLGRAQAVIRRQMADDAVKAKKAARDQRRAQWEADKVATEATGWDMEEWVEDE